MHKKPTPPRPVPATTGASSHGRTVAISVLLLVLVGAVFAPVWGFDFVSWDDPWYVTKNAHVAVALTPASITWALHSGGDFYWHPLTWLSHMLDVEMYGMWAGGHHLTNVVLHALNTLLLFWLLQWMTGSAWRSAFVAAIFAVHPIHVESVAWIAERKDVLSTFFWLITLGAYVRYAQAPGWSRYLAVALAFGLGLMAKPMIVTLPVVLLLLDVWPLRRLSSGRSTPTGKNLAPSGSQWRAALKLVGEKVPLFAMAVVVSVATLVVQRQVGAVGGLDVLPMSFRVSNAVLSYVAYVGQSLVPVNLAAFYPYPSTLPAAWLVFVAFATLCGALLGAAALAKNRPYVLVGIVWYLATLLPVIGLFQAGDQLRADRFMYVPLIGLLLIVAWGIPDLLERWRSARLAVPARLVTVFAVFAILACAVGASAQLDHWKNSESLWGRALAVTKDNHRALAAMGDLMAARGDLAGATTQYEAAVGTAPRSAEYKHSLGVLYFRQGRNADAARQYTESLELDPRFAEAHNSLGALLAREGDANSAIAQYREALRLVPGNALAHNNLGLAFLATKQVAEARRECEAAVRLAPGSAEYRVSLGLALGAAGDLSGATAFFEEATKLDPASEVAFLNLGVAHARGGHVAEALRAFESALRINPASEIARRAIAELMKLPR